MRQHKIEFTTTSVDGMWRKIVIIIIITVNVHQVSVSYSSLTLHLGIALPSQKKKIISPHPLAYSIQAKKFDYDCKSNERWTHMIFRFSVCCRCCRLQPHFILILLGNLVFRIYQFDSASVALSLSFSVPNTQQEQHPHSSGSSSSSAAKTKKEKEKNR